MIKVRELADELGAPAVISDELYYYGCDWAVIEAEHEKVNPQAHKYSGCDVRVAGFVLSEIGIPSSRQLADQNEKGVWFIIWA